jgi:hypothetical protein
MTELWTPDQPELSAEMLLVQQVSDIDPTQLDEPDRVEYDAYVDIVKQFSRYNPDTSEIETISPSRAEAIPAISARYCRLVIDARGELTPEEIVKEWATNIPENDGTRHPDVLFDIAQFNFGHDGPVEQIVKGLTAAETRRKEWLGSVKI